MATPSRKRKNVSIETKLQIIADIDSGRSRKDISNAFKLPMSTIGTIWAQKAKISDATMLGEMSPKRKRMRSGANPEVTQTLPTSQE